MKDRIRNDGVCEIDHDTEKSVAKHIHHIKQAQLPVCCPTQGPLWSEHPRVYIPLDETKRKAACPYCDAAFVLVD